MALVYEQITGRDKSEILVFVDDKILLGPDYDPCITVIFSGKQLVNFSTSLIEVVFYEKNLTIPSFHGIVRNLVCGFSGEEMILNLSENDL